MNTNAKPTLLDGGMGQEIVNRGGKGGYGEWALAALYENPELVYEIHRDYILAGADVITTDTYGSTRLRLRHAGIEERFAELLGVAGELACRARDEHGSGVRVAASLPPLEASYVNEFDLSFDQTAAQFAELMDLLEPYVDIYLGETLSTGVEARAFMQAAAGREKTVWLALTLDDHGATDLRGGESLDSVIMSLEALPDALLVNCTTPDSVNAGLPILRAYDMPFGAYANGFVEIPDGWEEQGGVVQLSSRADLPPAAYAAEAAGWLEAGASIIGGCCEIGPAHIQELRRLIDSGV